MLAREPGENMPLPKEKLRQGEEQYFQGDVRLFELTRIGWVKWLLKRRWFQFLMILPNQIIFWIALVGGFVGVVGATKGSDQFGSAITWYLWFAAVTISMVFLGRVWCLICPFGGFAEWIQRLTPWGKNLRSFTLGKSWPEKLAVYGIIPSAIVFFLMTFWEEFYGVAAPGDPLLTSYLVIMVFAMAIVVFLIFERRTFCRYVCPLTALIGVFNSNSIISGFRTKNRDTCLKCDSKECMRGSSKGYGCPWFEFPGSNASNLGCGLCTECIKNCPNDNIGLYIQPPLTNVHSPGKKRMDVAVAMGILWGMVWYNHFNVLPWYSNSQGTGLDDILNRLTGWARYPNPIDFIGLIIAVPLALLLYTRLTAWLASVGKDWKAVFITQAYALIPIVGTDYISRQLPKFWDHLVRVPITLTDPFGWHWQNFAKNPLWNYHILSTGGVVESQVILTSIGTLGSLYVSYRIWLKDYHQDGLPIKGAQIIFASTLLLVLLVGFYTGWTYVLMGGAE